ncbi:MAG: CopD family protein [Thermoleophilia bacterium]
MKELILAAASWLHLIATVVWIGGIAFILFIAMPSARQIMGTDAGKLMGDISRRFTPVANYSIALLVLTGAAMAVLNNRFSSSTILDNNWIIILAAKHILVFTMIVIHFYRGRILAPKIMKVESEPRKVALQNLSLNLVKANLGLGLMVLLLSAIFSSM